MTTPGHPSTPVARRAEAAVRWMRRTSRVVWLAARRRALRGWAPVHRAWRLSLQLRIVTITLVASGLLVGAFGFLLAQGITNSLLANKREDAQRLVAIGAADANRQMQGIPLQSDLSLPEIATDVVAKLASSPEQGGDVVVAIADRDDARLDRARVWPVAAKVQPVIDPELRRAVSQRWQVAHKHATVDLGAGAGPTTYLVYGAPVPTSWGNVELYYLFPLDQQIKTADQVARSVAAAGAALVLLLALIAGLVTRLVVRPVRLAARTAQRLSAGLLDQRMEVRGEDDLALLAASFNQMAANLQRQIQRLEEMSRLQRRFTSDVSHELRTPLTTVRMAADLIFSERESFDAVVGRSAELLQLELDRFESLLTDLLEISRFDAGFAALDAEPTDITAIVRRVAERLTALAQRAGVAIELDLPTAPVIAEVDARRVERVLRNLVGNAVEHGERRPVRVALAADEGAFAVTVRDHGIGLSPGEDQLIFNRFWRADPSRARQTGGTGLGLSIGLEDARLHGGWLEAWGAPGAGAQLRLTLPLRAGDRLISSPLRLVPADAYLDPDDGAPAPRLAELIPAAAPASSGLTSAGSAATGPRRDGAIEEPRPARAAASSGPMPPGPAPSGLKSAGGHDEA